MAVPDRLSGSFHHHHVRSPYLAWIQLMERLACMWIWRLPESPRWLVGQGRHTEAIAVLAALDDKPVDDPEILDTWKAIVDSANQSEGDFAFGELFQHGRMQHFRRTCLGILVQ